MKRLLQIIFALMAVAVIVPLILVSPARADGPTTCKDPVPLTTFLKGLDYQNKAVVYVRRGLNCELKGMSVIFKISDITGLTVYSLDKPLKEMIKQLPVSDPRRKELEARLGFTVLSAELRKQPAGNLFHRRAFGKPINYLSISVEKKIKLHGAFPKPIKEMIKAYRAQEKSAAVWARVQTAEIDGRNPRGSVSWIFLIPYRVES